jgi:hydrogenase expression/formation protein HypE
MRSILQLRTSESSGSYGNQLGSLNGKPTVESFGSVVRFRDPQIEMAHGAGGKASRRLVEGLFAPILFESSRAPLGDAAHVKIDGSCVAITTDSFVVRPLRFPGGSIGELAVNGTMNDLAVSGARGQAMVVTFVLEEGLPTSVLESEVRAMAAALHRQVSRWLAEIPK